MKKKLIYTILIAVFTLLSTVSLNAQPLPDQQQGGGAVPGERIGAAAGAPVGNGTLILLVMAMAYAGRKTYTLSQQEEE